MNQHTVRHPEEWTRFECGCEVGEDRHQDAVVLHRIAYCPLHAQAPAMREALEDCASELEAILTTEPPGAGEIKQHIAEARALLAAIDG